MTQRITRGAGIVKGWEKIHSRKTRITRERGRNNGTPSVKEEGYILGFREAEAMEVGPVDYRVDGQLQTTLQRREV